LDLLEKFSNSLKYLAWAESVDFYKESLIIQYDRFINIEMAEYLGVFLTKPNFIWKQIVYLNQGEQTAALALCEEFGIPLEKLHKSPNYC